MAKRQKKPARKKASAEAEMQAFLASKVVDQISDYSQRGRIYRGLSDEELLRSWESIWNELAIDAHDMKKRDIQADLASEFSLRKREPPWEVVRTQIDIFLKEGERAWSRQREQNPDADERASEAIEDDLEEFRNKRTRSH
jgi:hypothetical protein